MFESLVKIDITQTKFQNIGASWEFESLVKIDITQTSNCVGNWILFESLVKIDITQTN